MSKQVDERVVSMQFDNKHFERNVSTTMSTLDKLKQKLNFSGASKGLENVGTAAKNVNMSGLGNAVETIRTKFSALEVMGVTALANITNSAVNAGKRIVSSLTIEPIKSGFQEYETQMNAVQTILANTQKEGTNVKTVNKALDELNAYADKTIYNFTEMTRNIGTFTAAGVKLDTSVSSIKGIANLAAVSGSTSQQASTAMYQLSQAISSGTVKLMDWNSVVNAGMGGQVFQDALIRTSEHLKTGAKNAIAAEGSFRESLTTGWLTTEVLTQTLDQFATAADTQEEYEAAIKKFVDQGYSQEQAKQMADMARTAGEAATKVKTFTQLIDTLKEAVGSGWTTTWRLIIGDFEEAKSLWTSISDTLSDMINKSSEARNKIVEGWAEDGGRAMAIESLKNAFEGLLNIIKPIKEALRNVFPPTTSEQLIKITERIRDLTAKFKELTDKNASKIKSIFEGIFSAIKVGVTFIKAIISGISQLIGKFSGLGGGILNVSASLGDWITKTSKSITETNLFGKAIDKIVGFLGKAIDKLKEFGSYIKRKFEAPGLETLMNIVNTIWNSIKKVGMAIINVASKIGKALGTAFKNGDLKSLLDLVNGGIITAILLKLKSWISGFKDLAGEGKSFIGSIKDVLSTVGDSLTEWQNNIKAGTIQKIAISIGILAASLWVLSGIDPEKLGSALGAITGLFIELIGAVKLLDKLTLKNTGTVAKTMIGMSIAVLILASAMKKVSELQWDEIERGLTGVLGLMAILVAAAKILSNGGKKIFKGAIQMVIMAAALKILASVCKDLSQFNWIELAKGVSGIAGILLAFAGFQALMKVIKPKKMLSSALSLVIIGAAMEILADVCKKFGQMDWSVLAKAGAAIGGILLIASGFALLSGLSKKMLKSSVAIVIIGAAMEIFADVCKKFGQTEWESLAKAGAAIGGILVLAAGFSLLSGLSKKMLKSVICLTIMAAAMEIFADVCKIFGQMDWESLAKAGAAIGGILLLSAGFALLSGLAPGMLSSAAALLIIAAALRVLTPVLVTLGGLSIGEIVKGLVTIASAFAIFGLAGMLLGPVIPSILGLSAAIALFGVACLAVGVGVAVFAAGLMTLSTLTATSAAAIVAAIYIIVVGILQMIPAIVNALTEAIVAICQVFIQSIPAIAEAIKVLIIELMGVLVECLPVIVDGFCKLLVTLINMLIEYAPQLVTGLVNLTVALLNALSKKIPDLIGSLVGFLVALFNGISDHIGELIEAWLGIFGAIFEGVANAIGPIIENVIAPILKVLKNLIVGIVEAIAPYIPIICAAVVKVTDIICNAIVKIIEAIAPFIPNITHMVEVIADSFARIVEAIAPYIPDITGMIQTIVDAIVSIVEQISPIIDSITELIRGLGDVITEILGGIGDTIKDFGDAIKTSLDGVADVFDSAFGGIADIINSVGDTIKKFLDGIANVIDSVGEAALNSGTGFERLANGIEKITKLNLIDMAASMASVASGIGKITSHSEGLAQAGNGMQQIANGTNMSATAFNIMAAGITAVMSTLKMLIITVKSKASQFISVGKMLAIRFASGIKSGSDAAKTAFSNALSGAVSNARNYYNSFYNAGSYVAQGFANGIKDNAYKAADQAKAMAKNAATAAAEALKINSPSKVFRTIAYSIPEGFAQGIDKRAWMVNDSATGMAEAAVNNTKSIISHIANIISNGVDSQPTIRPVLDLTDVRNGASTIGSMLNGELLSVDTSSVGTISSMMNGRQNGSNDDVISAIKDLGKTIGNGSGNTYTINGITYDDGSAVSDAIQTLVRATRIERRT